MNTTINTTGEFEVSESPDQAVVNFTVTVTDDDQSVIAEEMRNISEEFMEALESTFGLADNVFTRNYNISPINQSPHDEEPPEYDYRGVHSYNLTVEDIDVVGDVVDLLVESGVSTVEGVDFNLSDETFDECREEAIQGAVNHARREAEIAADAEDLEIYSVNEMNVDRTHRSSVRRSGEVMMAMSAQDTTNIEEDDVTVSATVSVEYYLHEP